VAVLTVANLVLLGRETLDNRSGDLLVGVVGALACLLFAAPGLLIAVRARNVIGWCLVVVGLSSGLLNFGNQYATVALLTFPGSLPAARGISAALGQVWIFELVALGLVLLLFPDGRPPSEAVGVWVPLAKSATRSSQVHVPTLSKDGSQLVATGTPEERREGTRSVSSAPLGLGTTNPMSWPAHRLFDEAKAVLRTMG